MTPDPFADDGPVELEVRPGLEDQRSVFITASLFIGALLLFGLASVWLGLLLWPVGLGSIAVSVLRFRQGKWRGITVT